MPLKVRAVFFDAGNTLIYPRLDEVAAGLTADGYPATVEDFHAAERFGKARLDEWLWPQIRRGEVPRKIDHYFWGEYLGDLMRRVKVPQAEHLRVMRRLADRFRDITVWSRIFEDTSPYLAELRRRGYYLGVISNSIGTMEEQLTRLGLAEHFSTIIDSAVVGVEKPHPEIFAMALARAGVQAAEAVFVGDTYATDIGGAQLAGLTGVLIDRVGAYPAADCPRIETLSQLDAVLGRTSSESQN
jgi:HAD superfamily hydrolase (TIGR01509 family)